MTINQKIKDLVFSEMKKTVHSKEERFRGWDIHFNGDLFNFYILAVGGESKVIRLYRGDIGFPTFVVVETEDGSYELLKMMG